MSEIGAECRRRLWYGFRWCTEPRFDAATLKRFADGHAGEALQAERLRLVDGIELHTCDGRTGAQFEFTDVGGHFRGHIDGAIRGLLQAPHTWHCWEHKQVADASQSKLEKVKAERGEKEALEAWNPGYHAQAIVYMSYAGLDRHYLTCASPGGRRTVGCRTESDECRADRLREKARAIVTAREPLERISQKPEHYLCKWCHHRPVCHEETLPAPTCRTCVHATPELDGDGRWSCARHRRDLAVDAQRRGCPDHVYLPTLVPFEPIGADEAENWVEYRMPDGREFRNGTKGPGCYESRELKASERAGGHAFLGDRFVEQVRADFGGRIAEPAPSAA
jgi:hypothetical protein